MSARPHPCLSCGACCAHFRAGFYWAEADDATPGGVPVAMTEHLQRLFRVMKGTNQPAPHCLGLEGEIGASVCCSIWERRPSICREFPPSWIDGQSNERCDAAREAHGLAPLTPMDWIGVDKDPPPVTSPWTGPKKRPRRRRRTG